MKDGRKRTPVRGDRTTFQFDEVTIEAMDQLRVRMGASSRNEVIRRCIRIIKDATETSGDTLITLNTGHGPVKYSV